MSQVEPLFEWTPCMADQHYFAALSGDFNPMHLDPIQARRGLAGALLVHGIHGVIKLLRAHAKQRGGGILSLQAQFRNPVLLSRTVAASRAIDAKGTVQLWL